MQATRLFDAILTFLTLIFLAAICHAQGVDVVIDGIVAQVDGRPILMSDVQSKVNHGPLVILSAAPATKKNSPYEQALQDSINLELALRKMEDLEISISESELDKEITNYLRKQNIELTSLTTILKQSNTTYGQWKAEFKKQALVSRFIGRVIAPLVKITDKDVEQFYMAQKSNSDELIQVDLRKIFFKVSEDTDNSNSPKVARVFEAHEKLTSGMDFKVAVKIYSDDPDARSTVGLISGVQLSGLSTEIRDAVKELSIGDFTKPIKLGGGYYIFKLEKKSFSGGSDFDELKNKVSMQLRNFEIQKEVSRWLERQRRRSNIKIIKN